MRVAFFFLVVLAGTFVGCGPSYMDEEASREMIERDNAAEAAETPDVEDDDSL